jgi:hypothetical protein
MEMMSNGIVMWSIMVRRYSAVSFGKVEQR